MKKLSTKEIHIAAKTYMNCISKTHKLISKFEDKLKEIQANCPHSNLKPEERAWAPGHIAEGEVCKCCGLWSPSPGYGNGGSFTTTVSGGDEFSIDMSEEPNNISHTVLKNDKK